MLDRFMIGTLIKPEQKVAKLATGRFWWWAQLVGATL
jgi:hypothetical protein